jgi:sulfur-carrier protein
MAEVWIPPQLQNMTGGRERATVPGSTVRQLIDNLDREFPGLKEVLYDEEEDGIMPGLAVVIDGEASQLGLLDRVGENSEVHFLPAIGGGAAGR